MSPAFFTNNRHRLYQQLQPDGFVVLTAYHSLQLINDEPHEFLQEPNFWYLTGIDWADWLLIVDVATGEEWLVAPELDPIIKTFDGDLDAGQAIKTSGVQKILSKKQGRQLIKQFVGRKKRAYTLSAQPRQMYGFYTNTAQRDLLRLLKGVAVEDIRLPLAKLRAIKQQAEIDAIQQAVDVTVAGATTMLAGLPAMTHEYQAEAVLTAEFRRRGFNHAFRPILAAGRSACTIHHVSNNNEIGKNDWFLFDIGARTNGYAADMGRTIPPNDANPAYIKLYEAIISVQQLAISLMTPGRPIVDFMKEVETALHDTFARFGLLEAKDPLEKVYSVMPHAICHGLGVDVHDTLGRPEVFAENMVLAVEPGVYLRDQGVGIRTEDDVLITANGPKVLSAALPTSVEQLRLLCGGQHTS